MIGYLKGFVIENADGKLLVGIGSSGSDSSIGYAVTVPNNSEYVGVLAGHRIELFVHTHVREDALDLYGFRTKGEKELFLSLLSVTGIGPKGALGVMTKVSADELVSAIMGGDVDRLVKVPGIGKKTAERVVLELGDSFRKKMGAGLLNGAASQARLGSGAGATANSDALSGLRAELQDAKQALLALGYREIEISSVLGRISAEGSNTTLPKQAEDWIRLALRQL
ncbi:Holliday junction branch migration protein RuvA [Bdellovibrionota bacterium FG-2]